MKKIEWLWLVLVLLMFIAGLGVYPRLPDLVASHWNARGEVDGYSSKQVVLWLIPGISFILTLFFWAIPRIDPLKKNIADFRPYYNGFIIIFLLYMLGVHLMMLGWSLGYKANPLIAISVGLGILFFYAGLMMRKAKRNWFIGIRTPWTLSSESVWNKTHAIGGKLFQAAGILTLFGIFWPKAAIWIMLIPILGVSVYAIVYSYVLYQRENRA